LGQCASSQFFPNPKSTSNGTEEKERSAFSPNQIFHDFFSSLCYFKYQFVMHLKKHRAF